MARYFLELMYNGKNYNGWQIQPNAPSVQQTIEEALSTILRHRCSVVGAGRTDTGVHARFYVAHFDTFSELVTTPNFVYHLNCLLPFDIAVTALRKVRAESHARFDAIEREYRYFIVQRKDPFTRGTTTFFPHPLNLEAMNLAAELLLQTDDFTSFAKLHTDNKTNICRVTHACWQSDVDCRLVFTIRADRFLRNMVRAVVGSLLDVGRGRCTQEHFAQIIEQRDRCLAGSSVPADGLYLTNIVYPQEVYDI